MKRSHSGAQGALVGPLATVPAGCYLRQPQFGFLAWCFSKTFWRLSAGRLSFHQQLFESDSGPQQTSANPKLCLSSKHSWHIWLGPPSTVIKSRERPTNRWCQSAGSLDSPAIFLTMNTRRQFIFPSRRPKAPNPNFSSTNLAQISFCEPVPDKWTPAAPEPEMGKEVRRIQPPEVCCSQCCRSSKSLSSLAKLSGKFTSLRTKLACRLPHWLMIMQETNGILLACRKKLLTLGPGGLGKDSLILAAILNLNSSVRRAEDQPQTAACFRMESNVI